MPRDSVIEFATEQVYGATDEGQGELHKALGELVEEFGLEAITAQVKEFYANSNQPVGAQESLRMFAALILESNRPGLDAQIIGRLCRLDLAAGKPLSLSAIARRHGITKQAVSKRLAKFEKRLGFRHLESTEHQRYIARKMNRRNFVIDE